MIARFVDFDRGDEGPGARERVICKRSEEPGVAMAATVGVLAFVLWGSLAAAQGPCDGEAGTLADLVSDRSDLIYLTRALEETNLKLALQGPGPYVVFAPTDGAFERITETGLLDLPLSDLIQYHVLPSDGYRAYLDVRPGDPTAALSTLCRTCGDLTASIAPGGLVTINGGEATALDATEACNGLLVTVNGLLSPPLTAEPSKPSDGPDAECSPSDPACCDLQPPGVYSCAEQRAFNKCDEPWMIVGNGNGGFCQRTCGRCGGGGYYEDEDEDFDDGGGGGDDGGGDACRCTDDGVSGGADTGRLGCFEVSADVVVTMAAMAGREIGETLSQFYDKDESYKFAKYFGGEHSRTRKEKDLFLLFCCLGRR